MGETFPEEIMTYEIDAGRDTIPHDSWTDPPTPSFRVELLEGGVGVKRSLCYENIYISR